MTEPSHAIVTGSSGGIGSAVCRRFLRAGWTVTGFDHAPAGDDAAWRHMSCDLSEPGAAAAAAREVVAERPVAAVVHAAAVQDLAPAGELSSSRWRETLQVNLVCIDEIVGVSRDSLRAHRGSVVVIGSVHASATTRGMAAYAASKAALAGWVRAAALDLAPDIRVNAVAPGAVRTPMLEAGLSRRPEDGSVDQALTTLAAKTPLNAIGDAAQIAELVWVLTDPAVAGFVTGSTLLADGGALARLATE